MKMNDEKLHAIKTDPTSHSLETLLHHVISEYTQTTLTATGNVIQGLTTGDDGIEYVGLQALIQLQDGCPHNFSDFMGSANIHGLKSSEAFPWYCRSRIRYSCSNLTTAFVYYVVPKLKSTYGIVEL